MRTKGTKIRSRGTASPLTNPFLSLAVLDTNDAKASSVLRTDTLSRCLRRILFGPSRNRIKNQPYKRRRVGRNLRLSRADPALCSGQPSPLRCILLSPQGLATLRGPRLYGAYRRVGSRGPPRVTFGYFSSQKSNPPPGRRAVYAFAKGSAPPTGEMILWHDLCHQSSGSLRSPPPFTQGRLSAGAAPAGANEALTTIYFFFIISESPGQNIPIE